MEIRRFCPNQDYDKLLQSCLEGKLQTPDKLFEDDEFPPDSGILHVDWLRPGEICHRMKYPRPEMVVGGVDRFDTEQGSLGDCWYLAALANLAEDEEGFRRVVPENQGFGDGSYAGIFRFRFYRFGQWEEVVIDDRLPYSNGELMYVRPKTRYEFWSPLLEKAYAKFHGSYKVLHFGFENHAAVDFSGGIPYSIKLKERNMGWEKLFHRLIWAKERKAFMTCSKGDAIDARDNGLFSRHAYTITGVNYKRDDDLSCDVPLIRLRNPWGKREWQGDWSDLYLHGRTKEDGEFYMRFDTDFLKYFGDGTVAITLSPRNITGAGIKFNHHGTFQGCRDGVEPFWFSLTDPDPLDDEELCPVVVSLSQKAGLHDVVPIGFAIYRRDAGRECQVGELVETGQREVSHIYYLPVGRYCVRPSSRDDSGDFHLRVFKAKNWESEVDIKREQSRMENIGISEVDAATKALDLGEEDLLSPASC